MKTNQLFIGLLIIALVASLIMGFKSNSEHEVKEEYLWQQMTAVESVIPGGVGRSRLITQDSEGNLEEVKMENFFSIGGINFGNVRTNDQLLTDYVAKYAAEGWELYDVTSGVYSGSGKSAQGIFVTRYLFRKPK